MPYKDIEKQRKSQREWAAKNNLEIRLKAIDMLGGKCIRCGFDNFRALQIDHIVPDLQGRKVHNGSKNARNVVSGKLNIAEVQLLCANCHWIKTYDEDRKFFKNNNVYARVA